MSDGVWVQALPSGAGAFVVVAGDDGSSLREGYVTTNPHSEWSDGMLSEIRRFAGSDIIDWKELSYPSFFFSVFMTLPEQLDLLWLDGDPLPISEEGIALAAKHDAKWGDLSVMQWGILIIERMLQDVEDEALHKELRETYVGGLHKSLERITSSEEVN